MSYSVRLESHIVGVIKSDFMIKMLHLKVHFVILADSDLIDSPFIKGFVIAV